MEKKRMKINKNNFLTFLKKINMDGSEKINDVILDFNETGLNVKAMTQTNITLVVANLKSLVFEDYSVLGKIGVQDLDMLIKIMARFKDKIEIIVEGNLLTLKEGGKKVETELVDIQFIQETQVPDSLEFDEHIDISSGVINSFIADVSVNKEFAIILTTIENNLILKNTGKYKITETIKTDDAKGGTTAKFGDAFVSIMKNLTDDVTISFKTDYPLKVVEINEFGSVTIITAPRIDREE